MQLEFKSTGITHVPASYTRYTPGQIIWANVVYDNAPGTVEERGFVVLHDHRDRDSEMMIVLPATGEDAEHTPYDVFLSSWRTAGFQRPTWIRADRPRTIPKNQLTKMGKFLSAKDWHDVREAFMKVVSQIPRTV